MCIDCRRIWVDQASTGSRMNGSPRGRLSRARRHVFSYRLPRLVAPCAVVPHGEFWRSILAINVGTLARRSRTAKTKGPAQEHWVSPIRLIGQTGLPSKPTYELHRQGFDVSAELVRRLLHDMGYSLQALWSEHPASLDELGWKVPGGA